MSTPIIEGAKVMSKGQITLPKDIREKLEWALATAWFWSGMTARSS